MSPKSVGDRPFTEHPVRELICPPGISHPEQVFFVGTRQSRIRPPDPGVVERQAMRPLRIRCCEERRHPASLLSRDERRPLASDRVQDCAKIVDPRLDVGKEARAVREPGTPLVEDDQPREGGDPIVEAAPVGRMPCPDEVRHPVRDEHDVEGSSTHHLVGDGDVAASGVLHLRHIHGRSLAQSRTCLCTVPRPDTRRDPVALPHHELRRCDRPPARSPAHKHVR